MLKKLFKISIGVIGTLLVLIVALMFYVRAVSTIDPPHAAVGSLVDDVSQPDSGLFVLGNNWFRKSESGLYELYVEGKPFERGWANGKLTQRLVQYQEKVFNDQIHQLVPSDFYLNVLTYFVGWFNRDMDEHVPEEYKLEIYGVSHSASHEFDDIAPPYQRILNYHGAHDIGHALQNMSLVGCTSFATWEDQSEDGSLIVGRNFDFYVGDGFAENKIVAFYNPDQGHKFMMLTFGGMTGVLSGMNDQGLTVTINAAKSEIPSAAATPVSLVAREILQYAATIDEAYAIAQKRKMFVAESFLIGSARDGRAAIIEKTPEDIDLFKTTEHYIVCTNHFQGEKLGNTELNREHVETSASTYRYARVQELLLAQGKNSVQKSSAILRNQAGLKDQPIGLGNEKAINQLIAHHGIIFQPEKKLVWISTAPWQLGKFVCYDLNRVFDFKAERNQEVYCDSLAIEADPFVNTGQYKNMLKFNAYRFPFQPRNAANPDSLIRWNPESYLAYMLGGDIYLEKKAYAKAKAMYEIGLTKEVATAQEREHMKKNLQRCQSETE
ncbi:MAG: C45 family autoproteolytic acyltransferase/hydrolase [Bacteroidota bacterium]